MILLIEKCFRRKTVCVSEKEKSDTHSCSSKHNGENGKGDMDDRQDKNKDVKVMQCFLR